MRAVYVSGKSPYSKKIKFDNLCYKQVPEASENSSCGNDSKPDNNCPDVPEKPSCENNTKPYNPCNQQIPEYPIIAIPMIAVIGMLFIFQRRKN
jgi:hypothetical protein